LALVSLDMVKEWHESSLKYYYKGVEIIKSKRKDLTDIENSWVRLVYYNWMCDNLNEVKYFTQELKEEKICPSYIGINNYYGSICEYSDCDICREKSVEEHFRNDDQINFLI